MESSEPITSSLLACRFMAKLAHPAAANTTIPSSAHGLTKYMRMAMGPAIPQACPLARIFKALLNSTISSPERKYVRKIISSS